MSDPLQKQQPPQSQLDNEMKQNEQEQNAMWDSVALAALTEDDNNDNIRAGEEHNKNDQGDNGTVLAATSDVASVQSNSNGIQDTNNSANAFGESPYERIQFEQHASLSSIFFGSHKYFGTAGRLLCAITLFCMA